MKITHLLLEEFPYTRKDNLGIFLPGKEHPFRKAIESEEEFRDWIYKHARGECLVGTYTPTSSGESRFLVFDIDAGPKHSKAFKAPNDLALEIKRILKKFGIESYMELSKSGYGWHIWVFWDELVPTQYLHSLFNFIVSHIHADLLTLTSGEEGEIEKFPKQIKANVGNMIYLPLNGRLLREGKTAFYDENFELMEIEHFVLNKFPMELIVPKQVTLQQEPDYLKKEAWKEWRKKALNALELEDVYGDYLTGKYFTTGWLQCRDPWSPTGDRHPSAGVYADPDGPIERGVFHSFITGESMSVFDWLIKMGRVRDFREAIQYIAELTHTIDDLPWHNFSSNRPEILVQNRPDDVIISEAWEALSKWNEPPQIFWYHGMLIYLKEQNSSLIPEQIKIGGLMNFLSRAAYWIKYGKEGDIQYVPVPRRIAEMMLGRVATDVLPYLKSIVTIPVLDEKGNWVKPGYNPDSGIFFNDSRIIIPDRPFDATLAKRFIEEMIVDFPFVSESDKTHTVAALVLPFVRRLIDSPTPMHLIEAPTPGSGKSLLAKLITILITGSLGTVFTFSKDEEEVRKRITSALLQSSEVILFDNVSGKLRSESLASVLTSTIWADRMLGRNNMIILPNLALWLFTGNNLIIDEELTRRVVRIRLDPNTDKPWQRKGFKHPNLLHWVMEHRNELIWAIMSLVDEWRKQGMPKGSYILGSYESWSEVVSGVLEVNGYGEFMKNAEEVYQSGDDTKLEWEAFVNHWWEVFRDRKVKAEALLKEVVYKYHDLSSVIRAPKKHAQIVQLGKALNRMRDKVFDGFKILRTTDASSKSNFYHLEKLTNEPQLHIVEDDDVEF